MNASGGGLRAENVAPDDRIGHFEFGDEAAADLVTHPFVETAEVTGRAVAGEKDASASIENVLDGVEELELGLCASTEELDILDDEQPDWTAVPALPFLRVAQSHGRDEFTRELFGRGVDDLGGSIASNVEPEVSTMSLRFSGGRPREMGFTHARFTAEIELIETALALPRQCESCLSGERVTRADDEAFEAEGQLGLGGSAFGFEPTFASRRRAGSPPGRLATFRVGHLLESGCSRWVGFGSHGPSVLHSDGCGRGERRRCAR